MKTVGSRAGLILFAAILAASATAAADGTPVPSDEPITTLTLRAELPYTGCTFFTWFRYGGASVSVRVLKLVEAEVSVGAAVPKLSPPIAVTARAGVAPSIVVPRVSGTRWNLRVPALVGYTRTRLEGSETGPPMISDAITVASGLDATYWATRRVGFNVRLLVFGGVDAQHPDTDWASAPSSVGLCFGLGLDLGIAFRIQ
jgi:hypothetical protein